MNFDILISQVEQTHDYLQKSALSAVNINLSLRNWLIGHYIVEFEQQGSDRATYGERLLKKMAERLKHINGLSNSNLKTIRAFYLVYPQIAQLFTDSELINARQLKSLVSGIKDFLNQKSQTPSGFFENSDISILQSATAKFESSDVSILQTASAKFQTNDNQIFVPAEQLLISLSFSHFVEIIRMNDPLKRAFYEIEAIKGNWSVKQLQRQIATLLFERTGMSKNKTELIRLANETAEKQSIENAIRNPYFFEFVGLKDKDVVTESDLESALLDHIQDFLMELGDGFCFEARQKRIPFDTTYGRIDLVFYHRILKCHVLIELKVNDFDYSALTQLNTYIGYYRKNVMQADDKPTIGILLCTGNDKAMVEYALAGLDEKIFVSQYLLHIPAKEKLEQFIRNEIQNR